MTKNQIKRIKKNRIIKEREGREREKKKRKGELGELLRGKPQIKGITVKIYTLTPKKPNSALRKVAKVKVNLTGLTRKVKGGIKEGKNNNINGGEKPKKIGEEQIEESKGNLEDGKKGTKIIIAYIPEEKHTLTIHNMVLLRPGKTKDLPGVRYKIIRGVLDCK